MKKTFLTLWSAILLPCLAEAYIHASWPYSKLSDEADLVVIATPNASKETAEKSTLPDISPALPVLKVETTLDCLTVLKGDKDLKQIVLKHYRQDPQAAPAVRGPFLITFAAKDKRQFILFLKKDSDNQFVPVAGQTTPTDSIKEITAPQF